MRLQLDSTQLSSVENRPADAVAENGQAARAYSAKAGAGAGDSISLSGASSALSQMATERAAKIQQLTAAVRNGSYHVPSAAVSSAIVRNGLS